MLPVNLYVLRWSSWNVWSMYSRTVICFGKPSVSKRGLESHLGW